MTIARHLRQRKKSAGAHLIEFSSFMPVLLIVFSNSHLHNIIFRRDAKLLVNFVLNPVRTQGVKMSTGELLRIPSYAVGERQSVHGFDTDENWPMGG